MRMKSLAARPQMTRFHSRCPVLGPVVGLLAALVCLASLVQAQEGAGHGRRLTLLAGPLLISQRDEIASPLRYGGAVPFLEVGYSTRTDRRALAFRLGGGFGWLRSDLTGADDLPRQGTARDWIEVEYTRSLGAAASRTHWFVGALLAGHRTLIRHFYAQPAGTTAGTAFYSAGLGPVIAIEHALGEETRLTARVGVPLLALLGRPYGPFRGRVFLFPPHLPLRVATLTDHRAVDFTAAYTANVRRRWAIMIGHRLVVQRYYGDQPFHFASQSFSLAAALRLAGSR